jgi:hypothetical protein
MYYLGAAVFTVALIGSVADSNHRAIFAQTLNAESDDADAIYFTASDFTNRTLAIFPADDSPVRCQVIADYISHGDGAAVLTQQGFTTTECHGHKQKIDDNTRGNIRGEEMTQANGSKTTQLRATFIRQNLFARHAEGSAVRETLGRLSDEQLVALEDRETEAKIARIKGQNDKQN